MQWEHLTATDFAKAVRETGVCVVAMGVLEKHSEHLPLGTDFLTGHKIACLAAEKEPVVVFPPFYFGQIYEARCFPGAVTIEPTLLLELIQGVFDEIGRNGFKKIVIFNAHGGNNYLLGFLAQCSLWEGKPYSLYFTKRFLTPEGEEKWKSIRSTTYGGHACEWETSMVLGMYPSLVKMDRVPEKPAKPLNRLKHLPSLLTGVNWYSDHPDHYAGDARSATEEKGQILVQLAVESLVEYIAAVKEDKVVPTLQEEFFKRTGQISEAE